MSVLQDVINVFACGSQYWPDQRRRLGAISEIASDEAILRAEAEANARSDCVPYDLCHEVAVFGRGHPNIPVESDTQRGAAVIRDWARSVRAKSTPAAVHMGRR